MLIAASAKSPVGVAPPGPSVPTALRLDLPPFPSAPVLTRLEEHRHVTISRAVLTYCRLDGREIEGWGADLYEPRDPRRPAPTAGRALIVMLPGGGIRTDLTASWSRAFARRGFAALALHRLPDAADQGFLRSLRGTAKGLSEDAANLRRVLDWAGSLPGIDPSRVGVLGVSRGAISSALVAQAAPELSVVLVLGCADLPGFFHDSRVRAVEKMREREIARNGGSLDRAMARARTVLGPVDPETWAGRFDPGRTLLINARWDHVVPRAQALALRRAAGNPRQVWIPCGHYTTLLFARRVRRLALEHFTRTMGGGGVHGAATSAPEHHPPAPPR